MLYSTNCSNFIVRLHLIPEILDIICIVTICCPGCDIMNFEINLNFLIKPFFCIIKKSGKKCKYLKMAFIDANKKKLFRKVRVRL